MAEKVDQMDPDEKIVEIAIERLRVFENHPFRVEMDSQMKDLQDSIKKYGIITPVIVRPRKEGYYEIISGHRRIFAAEKLGYYPNAAARSLKTNRSYNIGVLFVDEANSGLTHEYFAAVLEGFKVEAEKQGYDITFINGQIGKKKVSYYDHCKYK